MRNIVFALTLLILGCAGRTFDGDSKDPGYHSGENSPFKLAGHGPDAGIAAAAVSATALAATPGYYKNGAIGGKLLCGDETTPALQTPCPRLVVILKSHKGKELARTTSEGGEFSFPATTKQQYRLEIESNDYQPVDSKALNYQRGDKAILRLKRIK